MRASLYRDPIHDKLDPILASALAYDGVGFANRVVAGKYEQGAISGPKLRPTNLTPILPALAEGRRDRS